MNNEEKSILDEVWDAVGLDRPQNPSHTPAPQAELAKEVEEIPLKEELPAEEPQKEELPAEEPQKEELPAEEPQKEVPPEKEPEKEETPEEAPAQEETPTPLELVVEKKKDVRFLVIYTVAFVAVISLLIGGSYLITSRIHREMAEDNALMNSSQSTLKNIQEENRLLKEQNQALQQANEQLSASSEENNALLESVGDMVEHGEYLSAAQNAYIKGNRNLARTILSAVDREKLSAPAKEYYDTLNGRLN